MIIIISLSRSFRLALKSSQTIARSLVSSLIFTCAHSLYLRHGPSLLALPIMLSSFLVALMQIHELNGYHKLFRARHREKGRWKKNKVKASFSQHQHQSHLPSCPMFHLPLNLINHIANHILHDCLIISFPKCTNTFSSIMTIPERLLKFEFSD